MNRKLTITMAATLAAASITIAAGCGGDSAQVPTAADLKGTWTQKAAGFEQGKAVTWSNQTIVIDTVDSQGFAGFKEYTPPGGSPQREAINGVIAPDGDILITDEDGFIEGTYADGVITGQYAETGADSAAMNVTITKK